jgi:hypothetical protein
VLTIARLPKGDDKEARSICGVITVTEPLDAGSVALPE